MSRNPLQNRFDIVTPELINQYSREIDTRDLAHQPLSAENTLITIDSSLSLMDTAIMTGKTALEQVVDSSAI